MNILLMVNIRQDTVDIRCPIIALQLIADARICNNEL